MRLINYTPEELTGNGDQLVRVYFTSSGEIIVNDLEVTKETEKTFKAERYSSVFRKSQIGFLEGDIALYVLKKDLKEVTEKYKEHKISKINKEIERLKQELSIIKSIEWEETK
jgi:hypothetical protein